MQGQPTNELRRRDKGKFVSTRDRSRSRSPVSSNRGASAVAGSTAAVETRECRWVYIQTPSVKDTRRLNERYWTCASLCSPNINWMATNWTVENENDEEEKQAAERTARDVSDDEEEVEEGSQAGSSSSSSTAADKTSTKKSQMKMKLSTSWRMTRRDLADEASTVMYFTHPVNMQLLRRHVTDSCSGCTVVPIVRGRGDPIRLKVNRVMATGTGLSTLGNACTTPYVMNMTSNPQEKYVKS